MGLVQGFGTTRRTPPILIGKDELAASLRH
jgi:hypothetical protein